jgi:hypothetical protein
MGFRRTDAAVLIGSLITSSPQKGVFIAVRPSVFQFAWFTNTSGVFSFRTLSEADIVANGWNNDVPLIASLQTVGGALFQRPDVPPGIFSSANGTKLQIVAFADDSTVLASEAEINYLNLTGDASLQGFTLVADPKNEAIHSLMLSRPCPDARRDCSPLISVGCAVGVAVGGTVA